MSSNTVYTGDNHGRTNDISMRGFSGVPILFDGVRITNKLAHPEVYNLESVEVLKGPASVQYGSDAIGGVINNQVAKKAIHFALDKRNKRRLITTIDGDTFEVAGISQFGLAYIFVHDKSINSLAKAKGKKFAYLKHDDAQRKILEAIGMVGLPSDVSDFAKKFNANQADVIASPAYAYKALEIEKGLGTIGAMFDNVPVVNITIELIIRPNSFPAGFSLNSREWFIQQIPTSFAMIKRLEDAIPTKYKYSISKQEVENYEKLFREQRIRFTKDGIYDPVMMGVLKRARCSVERTRFECSLGGE